MLVPFAVKFPNYSGSATADVPRDTSDKGGDLGTGPQPVSQINGFMTDPFRSSVESSPEAKALGLNIKTVDALFLKQVETHLNTLVWDAFAVLNKDSKVVLNLSTAKPEVKVEVPVPEDVCLPMVHKISIVKSTGSMFFCTLFGVSWLFACW